MKNNFIVAVVVLFAPQLIFAAPQLTDSQKDNLENILKAQSQWNDLFQYELKKQGSPHKAPSDPVGNSPIYKPIDDNCQITVIPPEKKGELTIPDGQKKFPMYTIDIQGSSCPIKAHITLDGTQAADGFDAKVVIETHVMADELKKQMDIDESNLEMEISAHQLKTGSDPNAPVTTNVNLTGKGNCHSQKTGSFTQSAGLNVVMTITPVQNSLPGISMTMSEEMDYHLSDFSAKLNSSVKMSGILGPVEEHDYINDQEVSKEEYGRFRSHIQLPTDQDSSQPAQSDHPLSCTVTVYDAANESLDNLNRAIQTHAPITVEPLLNQTSCSQNAMWSINHGPDVLMFNLVFSNQSVDLTPMLNGQMGPGLSYLLDEGSDHADQVGSFTYRMKCDPVPSCN